MKAILRLGATVLLASIALVMVLIAWTVMLRPAEAQTQTCGDRTAILAALADKYGERPLWTGDTPERGFTTTLVANPDGTTWTVVVQQGDKPACIVASGATWSHPLPSPAGTEG
jgi:hypothetical protein